MVVQSTNMMANTPGSCFGAKRWGKPFDDSEGGQYVGGEKIDYRYPETVGEALQRHLAKKAALAGTQPAGAQLAATPARANAPIPKSVATDSKPRQTKPVPSRTAPVGSRELAAAILADFGPAKCAAAQTRGLTYRQVGDETVAKLEAERDKVQADIATRERKATGIRFGGSFNAFGKHDPAA